MRASIAKNRAGIANIKIFMGGPSLRAFAEAGTKKNRTESPRSVDGSIRSEASESSVIS